MSPQTLDASVGANQYSLKLQFKQKGKPNQKVPESTMNSIHVPATRPFRALLFASLLGFQASAFGVIINNGSLSITIRNDNGAIGAAVFHGIDYFNAGTRVSDWGLQKGSITNTFRCNTTSATSPPTSQPVSVSGLADVSGTFTAGGANVAFVRHYSLVPGQNVLCVSTSFVNQGGTTPIRYFDTFDPDQGFGRGGGTATFNDVFNLGSAVACQARINTGGYQDTVIAGSFDPRARVLAGSLFRIDSGSLLNSFLSSRYDANDKLTDEGLHIGLEMSLAAGGADSFTYYLAFGPDPVAAQSAFLAAIAVPEPTTMIGGGLLLLPFGASTLRMLRGRRTF